MFSAALATGKRARTETGISESRVSVPSVAVDLARESIGDLAGRSVVVLGTGEMSELTAQALAAQGAEPMFVANRRRERARELAERFGGRVAGFDDLPRELERTDIVVAATSSPHPIVGHDELALVDARARRAPAAADRHRRAARRRPAVRPARRRAAVRHRRPAGATSSATAARARPRPAAPRP